MLGVKRKIAAPLVVQGRLMANQPTSQQLRYLRRGLKQPGGKLPIFDEYGREFGVATIRSCVDHGWAEPWFANPIKPYWMVCKLTEAGREVARADHSCPQDELA